MAKRQRLDFVNPEWIGPIEGWTVNYINKNVWRTQPQHDFDDLYQEAFIIFEDCRTRYRVEEIKHFFALYRRCVCNHIHWMSSARTDDSNAKEAKEAEALRRPAYAFDEFELKVLAATDPMIGAVVSGIQSGIQFDRDEDGSRETTNDFLLRLLGIREEVDIVGYLRGV